MSNQFIIDQLRALAEDIEGGKVTIDDFQYQQVDTHNTDPTDVYGVPRTFMPQSGGFPPRQFGMPSGIITRMSIQATRKE